MRELPPPRPPTVEKRASILAGLRKQNIKDSRLVTEHGEAILQASNGLSSLKEDVWSFLDQLAVAALEMGKKDLANVCIDRLNKRFPDSPRVKPLQGMYLEAEGHFDLARMFYEKYLSEDENNVVSPSHLCTQTTAHVVSIGTEETIDCSASEPFRCFAGVNFNSLDGQTGYWPFLLLARYQYASPTSRHCVYRCRSLATVSRCLCFYRAVCLPSSSIEHIS